MYIHTYIHSYDIYIYIYTHVYILPDAVNLILIVVLLVIVLPEPITDDNAVLWLNLLLSLPLLLNGAQEHRAVRGEVHARHRGSRVHAEVARPASTVI